MFHSGPAFGRNFWVCYPALHHGPMAGQAGLQMTQQVELLKYWEAFK